MIIKLGITVLKLKGKCVMNSNVHIVCEMSCHKTVAYRDMTVQY